MRSLTSKKPAFNMLIEFALIVAVVTIISVLVFQLNNDARADLTANSVGYNATIDADEAVSKIPAKLPLLATAVIFGVVLYVILRVIPIKVTGESF